MAERRMFAKSIVLSDAFLELSMSAQLTYYYLGMEAYDKGIIRNAQTIAKIYGAGKSDIDELVNNGFLIEEYEDGYLYYIITHWYENNGIGETAKKRNNYRYRQWRQKILDRDKVCQECGSESNLEVHHIKHFAEHPELRQNDNNAIVLCRKCHKELHRRERDEQRMDSNS